nr:gamma-glutamyl-gamma-aminobutyrate hydrolase family protein [uncultured Oscillibacter sp.]
MRPVIGMITAPNPKLLHGRHLINTSYVRAVIAAGGTPLLIPSDEDDGLAAEYLPLLHGLLVPGGEDVTPALYGEDPLRQVTFMNEEKDRMELALIRGAVERGMPVFGICRGIQLLNVCFGGTLYQDLPAQYPGVLGHAQDMAIRGQLTHRVTLEPDSLLEKLLGGEPLSVNSYHHQAVRTPAPGFTVTARAADGVIEGVEDPERNLYAVQWHPEDLVESHPRFRPLFRHLVERAEQYAGR